MHRECGLPEYSRGALVHLRHLESAFDRLLWNDIHDDDGGG